MANKKITPTDAGIILFALYGGVINIWGAGFGTSPGVARYGFHGRRTGASGPAFPQTGTEKRITLYI